MSLKKEDVSIFKFHVTSFEIVPASRTLNMILLERNWSKFACKRPPSLDERELLIKLFYHNHATRKQLFELL